MKDIASVKEWLDSTLYIPAQSILEKLLLGHSRLIFNVIQKGGGIFDT